MALDNPKILFIVNGDENSIYARRVKSLSAHFKSIKDYKIVYRDNRKKSILKFIKEIIASKPDIVYVEQIAYSGCMAAIAGRLFRKYIYILCASDAYAELLKANHNILISRIAGIFETIWLNSADFILTCNPLHSEWLKEKKGKDNVDYVEHSVDAEAFKPRDQKALKRKLGLEGSFVIGLIGSVTLGKRYNTCYGWDLIETYRYLSDLDCKGLIVGDGTGLPYLKRMAGEYGLQDRVIFLGNVVHEKICDYINCMDISMSTQSNDLVGYLRCPTKLSEYMACGRYIISTDVGYATLYVDDVGELLHYEGVRDNSYPQRLADRLRYLYGHREILAKGERGIEIAERKLSNKVLSEKLERIITEKIRQR